MFNLTIKTKQLLALGLLALTLSAPVFIASALDTSPTAIAGYGDRPSGD